MIFAFGWKSTYQSKILTFNVSFALLAEELYFLTHNLVDVIFVFSMMDYLGCVLHCKGDILSFFFGGTKVSPLFKQQNNVFGICLQDQAGASYSWIGHVQLMHTRGIEDGRSMMSLGQRPQISCWLLGLQDRELFPARVPSAV